MTPSPSRHPGELPLARSASSADVAGLVLALAFLPACARPSPTATHESVPPPSAPAARAARAAPASRTSEDPASGDTSPPPSSATEPRIDPDGNDDDTDPGNGSAPTHATWRRVGKPPLALSRICDLTPLHGALYAAHAHRPLGTDGATVTRYDPADTARPFRVAFDWNRPGEPTKGGGAGQGFLRVRAIDGRLFVPDADPPYAGLGLVEPATEGYVFVSDALGAFAPPRMPKFRPPAAPELLADGAGRAGAAVLPRAYHVIDVVRFRGALFASTGSVPPGERAWSGPSPGALHRASASGARWSYEVGYPHPYRSGVWRLTYLVRFRDRLYAGIQDYDGRDPHDFVVFTPPAPAPDTATPALRDEDMHPTRITRTGASSTLRWWVDTRAHPHRLYWVAWTREGVGIFVTTDGDHWTMVSLPPDSGAPTDITRFRDAVVVLTTRGLYRLNTGVDGPLEVDASSGAIATNATLVAPALSPPDPSGKPRGAKPPRSPFQLDDSFCAAPLAVLDGELYAGSQIDGALYVLAPAL